MILPMISGDASSPLANYEFLGSTTGSTAQPDIHRNLTSASFFELDDTTSRPSNANPRQRRRARYWRTQWSLRPLVSHHYDNSDKEKWSICDYWNQCVFAPESKVVAIWNYFILFAVTWTLIVLPLEVSVTSELRSRRCSYEFHCHIWFVLDCVTTIVFILDLLVQFNSAFYDPSRTSLFSDRLVFGRVEIARNYLGHWFFVDLVCAAPVELLHMLVVARLIKIWRLVRHLHIWRTMRDLSFINTHYWLLRMLRCLIVSLTAAHWIACFWAGLALDTEEITWLDALVDLKKGVKSREEEESPGHLYMWSMYFACTMITTVGFGDITPQTDKECLFALCSMGLGAICWAYMMSCVFEAMSTSGVENREQEMRMDGLIKMMEDWDIDVDLQCDVVQYYQNSAKFLHFKKYGDLMNNLSPTLRGRVRKNMWGKSICKVPFMRRIVVNCLCPGHLREEQGGECRPFACVSRNTPRVDAFVFDMCQLFEWKVFAPGERLPRTLTIIQRGIVGIGGFKDFRVLVRGDYFGEDFLCTSANIWRSPGMALSHVSVLSLPRKKFNALLLRFPEEAKHVRPSTRWFALRAALLDRPKEICLEPDTTPMSKTKNLRGSRVHWTSNSIPDFGSALSTPDRVSVSLSVNGDASKGSGGSRPHAFSLDYFEEMKDLLEKQQEDVLQMHQSLSHIDSGERNAELCVMQHRQVQEIQGLLAEEHRVLREQNMEQQRMLREQSAQITELLQSHKEQTAQIRELSQSQICLAEICQSREPLCPAPTQHTRDVNRVKPFAQEGPLQVDCRVLRRQATTDSSIRARSH